MIDWTKSTGVALALAAMLTGVTAADRAEAGGHVAGAVVAGVVIGGLIGAAAAHAHSYRAPRGYYYYPPHAYRPVRVRTRRVCGYRDSYSYHGEYRGVAWTCWRERYAY